MKTTLKQIDKLQEVAKTRNDTFYYEALKQLKDFVIVEHDLLFKQNLNRVFNN